MSYKKIFKWLLVTLFVVGIITSAFGFINGWPETKQWAADQKTADELPPVVEELTAELNALDGTERPYQELKAIKPQMDTLSEQTKAKSERMASLLETINNEKSSRKKKDLQNQHQAEIDSLTNEINTANATLREFNVAYKLAENKANLSEAEGRIASGNASVNTILYSTYVMFVIAIIALFIVIFVITGMNSPLGLGKILLGVLIIGVIIFAAWQLAPGSQLHPEKYYIDRGLEIPAEGDLKMTDAVLYLAYLLVGATAVALVTSWVVAALRK